MLISPPSDIKPERLWRILIQRQRASWPLSFRVHNIEHDPLRVVALRGIEAADALDVESLDVHRMASEKICNIVAASVYLDDERVFRSAKDVGMLSESEVYKLGAEVIEAISRISPVIHFIDVGAWRKALKDGASHPSNLFTAARVASCADLVSGFTKVARPPQPERWFGLPVCELTDGQLLAYDAAKAAIEKE